MRMHGIASPTPDDRTELGLIDFGGTDAELKDSAKACEQGLVSKVLGELVPVYGILVMMQCASC
jgi:hypothetical protein